MASRAQVGPWLVAVLLTATLGARALELDCGDGADADTDTLVDCDDPDCVLDPACAAADHDGDAVLNTDDCAPLDPEAWLQPSSPATGLRLQHLRRWDVRLTWDDAAPALGPATIHDVVLGVLSRLRAERGTIPGAIPAATGLGTPAYTDSSPILRPPAPAPAEGYWYLVRSGNPCGSGPWESAGLDPAAPWEEADAHCANGLDDDGDGLVDCDDPECAGPGCPERCANGADDDGDRLPDCWDPDCAADPACGEDCLDGVDDDGDTLVDCEDPECHGPACPEQCAGGLDEDGDTSADCADPDCFGPACAEECRGGRDEDGDGLRDCDDPDCFGSACAERCTGGLDEDGDTLVDCADPDCANVVPCCPTCVMPTAFLPAATFDWQTVADATSAACGAHWYGLPLVAGQTVEISTCPPFANSWDTVLELRAPGCGSVVAANDDWCGLRSSIRYTPTTTGVFSLQLRGALSDRGPYTIGWRRVDPMACTTCATPDPFPLVPAIACATVLGQTAPSCPTDHYRVDLAAGETYWFSTQRDPSCPSDGCAGDATFDTTLTLLDATCAPVATNDDCGTGGGSALTYTAPAPGPHVLVVGGSVPASVGNYTLAHARLGCSSCGDVKQHLAAPTPACQDAAREITASCPEVWFDLPVLGGAPVELSTCGTTCGGGASLGTVVEVFDEACAPVAAADTGCEPLSLVTWTPASGSLVHVRVTARTPGESGPFVLSWRLP